MDMSMWLLIGMFTFCMGLAAFAFIRDWWERH